jgi:putative SOS response-associated peptidase YedK
MCGRYELSSHPTAVALAFGLAHPPDIHARYNIAPTQQVPIVRVNRAGERELVQVRWGLVPRWAKDPSIGVRMINARAETLTMKGAFRNAYARHRCLVPVSGFYEWQASARGKQPLHIGMPDGRPFGLAGLYERWLSPDGEVLDTCTIVTAPACDVLRTVHDRMPVIVPPAQYTRWLDGTRQDVGDLLVPWDDALRIYAVSKRVNTVANDDAQLCEPIEVQAPGVRATAGDAARSPPVRPTHDDDTTEEPAEDHDPVQQSLL